MLVYFRVVGNAVFGNHAYFPTLFCMDLTSGFPHAISLLINPKNSDPLLVKKKKFETCSMSSL